MWSLESVYLATVRKLLHDSEQVSSPLGAVLSSTGEPGRVRMVAL